MVLGGGKVLGGTDQRGQAHGDQQPRPKLALVVVLWFLAPDADQTTYSYFL